jgi:hypothetical protein
MVVAATRTGAVMVMTTATCAGVSASAVMVMTTATYAGVSASTRPVIIIEAGRVIQSC